MTSPDEGVGSLRVLSAQVDGACVVELVGDVDVATSPGLRGRLARLVTEGETSIVVNLERVGFMDSTGLGVLVGALKQVRQVGGNMTLRSPRRSHLKVFEITGLDKVFDIDR